MYMSRSMPCADCGASVERADAVAHTCEPGRRLDYLLLAMRGRILAFEDELRDYLAGDQGRFEVWMAARDVRRSG